jgi:hypothetical protein
VWDESFTGRRGILHFGQFKAKGPYYIADGIFIVPSGWHMLSIGSGAFLRMNRSHFVAPTDWSDDDTWKKFRDWLIFDSFVMMNERAITYFDDNILVVQDVSYAIDSGTIGDDGDLSYTWDYNDVTSLLVDEIQKPSGLPSLSYAELYKRFQGLPDETRSAIEWFVSSPPSPRRVDAFFGSYWKLLHMTILIENLIGLPPTCGYQTQQCDSCRTIPPPHRAVPRRRWLRDQLSHCIRDDCLVETYARLIEAAKSVRDRMSHGPEFDRSSRPIMAHGHTTSYGVESAVGEFKQDSNALLALLVNLRSIAHALLVHRAFNISHFRPYTELKAAVIGQSPA